MSSDVTRILNAIERGDAGATDKLLPLAYEELCLLSGQKLPQENASQTRQATALVHEVCFHLLGDELPDRTIRGAGQSAAAFKATSRTSA